MFVHYFMRLRTNHFTLLTNIADFVHLWSARNLMRNLSYHPLWRFMKISIARQERRNVRWEKWLARRFTKCHLQAGYTLIAKYTKMGAKCEKRKVYRGISRHFFRILRPLFRFSHFAPGSAFTRKLKRISGVYLFTALTKHEIRRKCIVSVLYFVMCFVKTSWNTKSV